MDSPAWFFALLFMLAVGWGLRRLREACRRAQRSDWGAGWLNFLDGPADVEVEIARETWRGRAEAITEDGERLRNGVRTFLTAVPRDAVVYGIKLDRDRRPREQDIENAAGHVVLVEIELEDRGRP